MPYTQHTWVTGETITAAKLNNIETGVSDNGGTVADILTALQELITDDGNGLIIQIEGDDSE